MEVHKNYSQFVCLRDVSSRALEELSEKVKNRYTPVIYWVQKKTCDIWGGDLEPGMMYFHVFFALKWGAKEPQNP